MAEGADLGIRHHGNPERATPYLQRIALGSDDQRNLYSFPTAGTLVPMYDLEVETLSSILSTNA